MQDEHSGLSISFGTCVGLGALEGTAQVMTSISPEDPVISAASYVMGSIVGGLAAYGSSVHLNTALRGRRI